MDGLPKGGYTESKKFSLMISMRYYYPMNMMKKTSMGKTVEEMKKNFELIY